MAVRAADISFLVEAVLDEDSIRKASEQTANTLAAQAKSALNAVSASTTGVNKAAKLITNAFTSAEARVLAAGKNVDDFRKRVEQLQKRGVAPIVAINRAAQELTTSFGGLSKAMTKVLIAAGIFGTLRFAVQSFVNAAAGVGELARNAAKLADTEVGFRRLASQTGNATLELIKIRKAAGGAIDDFTLLGASTKAALAGLPIDRMDEIVRAARALAAVTSRDAAESVTRLTEAITKQERRMLDELGIVVRAEDLYKNYAEAHNLVSNSLTAEQKAAAFLEGTLTAVNDKVASLGGIIDEAQHPFLQLDAAVREAGQALGEWLRKQDAFIATVGVFAGGAGAIRDFFREPEKSIAEGAEVIDEYRTKLESLSNLITEIDNAAGNPTAALTKKLKDLYPEITNLSGADLLAAARTKALAEETIAAYVAMQKRVGTQGDLNKALADSAHKSQNLRVWARNVDEAIKGADLRTGSFVLTLDEADKLFPELAKSVRTVALETAKYNEVLGAQMLEKGVTVPVKYATEALENIRKRIKETDEATRGLIQLQSALMGRQAQSGFGLPTQIKPEITAEDLIKEERFATQLLQLEYAKRGASQVETIQARIDMLDGFIKDADGKEKAQTSFLNEQMQLRIQLELAKIREEADADKKAKADAKKREDDFTRYLEEQERLRVKAFRKRISDAERVLDRNHVTSIDRLNDARQILLRTAKTDEERGQINEMINARIYKVEEENAKRRIELDEQRKDSALRLEEAMSGAAYRNAKIDEKLQKEGDAAREHSFKSRQDYLNYINKKIKERITLMLKETELQLRQAQLDVSAYNQAEAISNRLERRGAPNEFERRRMAVKQVLDDFSDLIDSSSAAGASGTVLLDLMEKFDELKKSAKEVNEEIANEETIFKFNKIARAIVDDAKLMANAFRDLGVVSETELNNIIDGINALEGATEAAVGIMSGNLQSIVDGAAKVISSIASVVNRHNNAMDEARRKQLRAQEDWGRQMISLAQDISQEISDAIMSGMTMDVDKIMSNFIKAQLGQAFATRLQAELGPSLEILKGAITAPVLGNAALNEQFAGPLENYVNYLKQFNQKNLPALLGTKLGAEQANEFLARLKDNPDVDPYRLAANIMLRNNLLNLDPANAWRNVKDQVDSIAPQLQGILDGFDQFIDNADKSNLEDIIPTATLRAVTEDQANQMLLVMSQQANFLSQISTNTGFLPQILNAIQGSNFMATPIGAGINPNQGLENVQAADVALALEADRRAREDGLQLLGVQ